MLNSPLLNAVLGLLLTYALFGLLVSSLQEVIATGLSLRARTLIKGIKDLLNDPGFNGLALQVYNHALVNPLDNGQTAAGATPKVRPSYIPAENFALALLDCIGAVTDGKLATTCDQLTAAIPDAQLKTFLRGVLNRANGDLEQATAELATWFDAAMDRLSGDYKRNHQLWSLGLGFLLALSMNIDTIALFNIYWKTPTAQLALGTPAVAAALSQQADGAIASHGSKDDRNSTNRNANSGAGPATVSVSATSNTAGATAQPAVYTATTSTTAAATPITTPLTTDIRAIDEQVNLLESLPIGPGNRDSKASYFALGAGYLLTALSALFGAPFWFGLLQNLVNIRGTGNKPEAGK